MSTLSVETSSRGSSTSTSSPSSFSQRVTVPSVTDSPSSGIVTVWPSPPPPPEDFFGFSSAESSWASSPCAGSSAFSSCAGSSSAFSSCAGSSSAFSSSAGSLSSSESPESSDEPPSSSPMTARSPPTSTVSSSSARISCSTPATGEGISVSTLSVETSSSGSSTATSSPTPFSQRVTVPSVTDSPSSGIVTFSDIPCLLGRSLSGHCQPLRAHCPRSRRSRTTRGATAAPCSSQVCACSGLPARARWASPRASFWVGWAWMRAATSSGMASQL